MSLVYCCCPGAGGTTHKVGVCTCNVPDTVNVHIANPPDPTLDSFAVEGPITWQARPSDILSTLGTNPGFWGPRYTVHSGNYIFRPALNCDPSSGGFYVLTGILTTDSPSGGFPVTTVRFYLPGFPGNTCTPFSMTNGGPSTGFYSTQGITIDG